MDNIYRNIPFIYYSSFRLEVKNPKPLLTCLIRTLLKMIKYILLGTFNYPSLKSILYFEPSINNQKSLNGTKHKLLEEDYSSYKNYNEFFPKAWEYIYSFTNIKSFFKYYRSLNSDDKDLVRFYFENIFLSKGKYIVLDKCLHKNPQLKVIVTANDHIEDMMCLKFLAPKYGVKIIYTQHASITDRFPCLDFDYSFLDGFESYEKYSRVGISRGKIYISGSPRFDELYSINRCTDKQYIGIAINTLDSIRKIEVLCQMLIDHSYKELLLRPHPAMVESIDWNKFKAMGIEISYPSNESSFTFLNRLKIMISNESGIHLDAALFDVPSVLYNLSDYEVQDWYGYLDKGLIPIAHDYRELCYYLDKENCVNNNLVQYYNASHKSQHQGQVGAIIGEYVYAIAHGNNTKFLDEKYFNYDSKYYIIK